MDLESPAAHLRLLAHLGAVCGDQMFFHLGRRQAKRLLARFRFPWASRTCGITDLVDDFKRFEYWIAGGLIVIGVIAFLRHAGKPRRKV